MDFIANRIQLKIAWLSYVVIQSHFSVLTNKVDKNERMWREKRRLLEIFSIRTHSLSIYNSTRIFWLAFFSPGSFLYNINRQIYLLNNIFYQERKMLVWNIIKTFPRIHQIHQLVSTTISSENLNHNFVPH